GVTVVPVEPCPAVPIVVKEGLDVPRPVRIGAQVTRAVVLILLGGAIRVGHPGPAAQVVVVVGIMVALAVVVPDQLPGQIVSHSRCHAPLIDLPREPIHGIIIWILIYAAVG